MYTPTLVSLAWQDFSSTNAVQLFFFFSFTLLLLFFYLHFTSIPEDFLRCNISGDYPRLGTYNSELTYSVQHLSSLRLNACIRVHYCSRVFSRSRTRRQRKAINLTVSATPSLTTAPRYIIRKTSQYASLPSIYLNVFRQTMSVRDLGDIVYTVKNKCFLDVNFF